MIQREYNVFIKEGLKVRTVIKREGRNACTVRKERTCAGVPVNNITLTGTQYTG